MLPAVIDYLLALRQYGGAPGVYGKSYQAIIPNFPPLRALTYDIRPSPQVFGYILYQWVFGEAMIPHAFDVKIDQGGNRIFDAIISGYFTTNAQDTFLFVTDAQPITVTPTNLRTLVNYYELTTFYLSVPNQDVNNAILDALRRMHTSRLSEELAKQSADLLKVISQGTPYGLHPPISGGR